MLSQELSSKELNDYMRSLRSNPNLPSFMSIDFPTFDADPIADRSDVREVYRVSGIRDEVYAQLNDTYVYQFAQPKLVRRKRNSIEQVIRDEDGDEVWEFVDKPTRRSQPKSYKPKTRSSNSSNYAPSDTDLVLLKALGGVPEDYDTSNTTQNEANSTPFGNPTSNTIACTGILSPINLRLPYQYEPSEDGLGYADKWRDCYGYYVPDQYLHKVNMTALAISTKRNIKTYHGYSITTWGYGQVFVGVMPYVRGRAYTGVKILGVKIGSDWNEEIQRVFDFMVETALVPLPQFVGYATNDPMVVERFDIDEPYVEVDPMSLADRASLVNLTSN